MSTKVVRISEDAEAICLQYGKTISEGIRIMEAKLQEQKKTSTPPDMKALERMIRNCIQDELETLTRGY